MSELPDNFEPLKAEYEAVRYPGDLAMDLGLSTRSQSFWRRALPYAAAAAIVLIAIGLIVPAFIKSGHPGIVTYKPPVITPATLPAYDVPSVAEIEVPAADEVPSFPTDVPSLPSDSLSSFPSFPSAPSMPSLDSSEDTNRTNKEQV